MDRQHVVLGVHGDASMGPGSDNPGYGASLEADWFQPLTSPAARGWLRARLPRRQRPNGHRLTPFPGPLCGVREALDLGWGSKVYIIKELCVRPEAAL